MNDFIQFIIILSGLAAIILLCRGGHLRRWGCLCGLVGQPFWIWANLEAGQWGILILSICYTVVWAYGFLECCVEKGMNRDD